MLDHHNFTSSPSKLYYCYFYSYFFNCLYSTEPMLSLKRFFRNNIILLYLYNIIINIPLSTVPFLSPTKGNTFRLKRSIFDQVMLLKRLEEEQSILVKEMSQHIKYLLKQVQEVESLRGQTLERIKTSSMYSIFRF